MSARERFVYSEGETLLQKPGVVVLSPEKVLVLGACYGVLLSSRGPGDKHICFDHLVEDDGNWFISGESSMSSFWLEDLGRVHAHLRQWLKDNAVKWQWGWMFR